MSKQITEQELDELDALCSAATPGPWEATPDIRPDVWAFVWAKVGGYFDEGQIVRRLHAAADHIRVHIAELAKYESANEDAEFIARSRTAMPALVAEVRRLRGLLAGGNDAVIDNEARND